MSVDWVGLTDDTSEIDALWLLEHITDWKRSLTARALHLEQSNDNHEPGLFYLARTYLQLQTIDTALRHQFNRRRPMQSPLWVERNNAEVEPV